jgi:hypothetical protein
LPFTFAPIARCPTSVWIEYAKSTGVAPCGRFITSPFGVKTKTRPPDRSIRRPSMNSRGSAMSFSQSIIWPNHARSPSFVFDSLYRQCAAIPNWAVRCMSRVRIWISSGLP